MSKGGVYVVRRIVIGMDFFVVALLIQRDFAMFRSVLGTWLPFGMIFLSMFIVGLVAQWMVCRPTRRSTRPRTAMRPTPGELYGEECRGTELGYYLVKIVVTTILIVAISEIAKRSSLVGAILASVPLVSVLAMIWLYIDTKDVNKVSALSSSVFWLVLPSLALFLVLPQLLKYGLNFYLSLGVSVAITVVCYFLMVLALNNYGVKL
jgi:hypothetical protein